MTCDLFNFIGVNVTAYHGLPIAVNMASNLLLKNITNNAKIKAYIQSLPTTKQQTAQKQKTDALIYSTWLASIIYNIVYEKENLSKLQLLVSGLNSLSYWLGNYLFDVITIIPSCLFAIILVYAFDTKSFLGEALLPLILILLLYGISIVPFTYLFSWCFKSSTKAQYIALISYIFYGYAFGLAT